MSDGSAECVVGAVSAGDPDVAELLETLTRELATGGYSAEQTFGYSVEQIERSGVHLVGARVGTDLVGVAGLEPQADGTASAPCRASRPTSTARRRSAWNGGSDGGWARLESGHDLLPRR